LFIFYTGYYRIDCDPLHFIYQDPVNQGSSTPVLEAMAEKTLREFSSPQVENIRTGPTLQINAQDFELKPSLINMVQATSFSGKVYEDANAHLQNFLEIGATINIKNIPQDVVLLRLFPFSLTGKAKRWFYSSKEEVNTWEKCSKTFLAKFFPIGKTNALREKITNFQQLKGEATPEAWERLQGYIFDCPHHGMEDWLLLQGFYHGLTQRAREQLDATAGGSFLSLTTGEAEILLPLSAGSW
jgi:hypothetical protein